MTFTKTAVRDEVFVIFERHLAVEVRIAVESSITGDLLLDSLAVMEVIADVEDRFEIRIPEDTLPEMRTVNDVIDQLLTHLEHRGRLTP